MPFITPCCPPINPGFACASGYPLTVIVEWSGVDVLWPNDPGWQQLGDKGSLQLYAGGTVTSSLTPSVWSTFLPWVSSDPKPPGNGPRVTFGLSYVGSSPTRYRMITTYAGSIVAFGGAIEYGSTDCLPYNRRLVGVPAFGTPEDWSVLLTAVG